MAGAEKSQQEDVSSLIAHYDSARKPGSAAEIGQVVFVPVLNMDYSPTIADATRSDPHAHQSANLHVRPLDDKVDFRGKPNRLPLAALSLGQTEELIVSRAKKRPCVVLGVSEGVNPNTMPKGSQRNHALKAFGAARLLAPVFSVSTANEQTAFGPVMMARVKALMYPEFMFLPQSGLIMKNDSVMRLDRLFWSYLHGAAEPQNLFLSQEALGIAWTQISMLAGNASPDDYAEMRELLLSYLPEDCRAPASGA